MKQLLLSLFLIAGTGTFSSAQIIYSNDFSGGSAGWTLTTANNIDSWVVNSSYCAEVPNTGGGNYLHVANLDLEGPCATAAFLGFGSSGNCTATMTSGFSTLGQSSVSISFSWICVGSTSFLPSYGSFSFSTNGGGSWTAVTVPRERFSGQSTWTTATITSDAYPALLNKADVRLRFGWTNSGVGSMPSFSVDNLVITGGGVECANEGGMVSATVDTVCSGEIASLTLSGSTGTIQWQQSPDGISWTPVSGGTGATTTAYTSNPLSATTYYRAVLSQPECPDAFSTSKQIIVLPVVTPQVSITADPPGEICEGQPVVFTATAINAGGKPAYAWYKNGVLQEETGTPYTLEGPADGDSVYCRLVTDVRCAAADTVFSTGYEVVVNPLPVVSLVLPEAVCQGVSFELSAGLPEGGTYSGSGVSENMFDTDQEPGEYVITYSYSTDKGCSGEASDTIAIDNCTGLEEAAIGEPVIFPNPSSGTLCIHSAFPVGAVDLYSVDGKRVARVALPVQAGTSFVTDLNGLPAGVYFVEIHSHTVIYRRKLVLR